MSVRAVAARDFATTTRSRGLWAAGTLFAALFAAIAFAVDPFRTPPRESVLELLSTLSLVLALLVPIVALVVSYMAIAGARESGAIKFLLSVPTTRRDVFLGKLASRLTVVGGGVCFVLAAATCVAVARHGALPLGALVGLLAVTLLYGSVFVGVAVALSGAVAARSRAIAAAVGSYFVLVILFVVPAVRITAIVRWLHTAILGLDPNPDLYAAVSHGSPYVAYRKATNLAFPQAQHAEVFRRPESAGDLPLYLTDEFSLVVLAAWLVVPVAVGYLRFRGADLE